jgi:drug/metabolite transporter (DMT)-like permease
MSPDVLALVIAAAFAHAGWNLIAKGAQGGAAFVWSCAVAGTVLYAPVLILALATDPGRLDRIAVALMAGSGALHAVYFVLLQRGYAAGDLSVVYPLARGTGPLLATIAAIAFLGERPGVPAMAGAALIVVAVLSLIRRSDEGTSAIGRGTVYAVLTGTAIAGYTLWDKHAVGAAALSPVIYYWGTNLANALVLTPVALGRRSELGLAWTSSRLRALGVGLLSPLAYVLILYALARAPVSYVAPARESSIVIGTLLGALVLHEGDTPRRVVAAVAILAGIVALVLG